MHFQAAYRAMVFGRRIGFFWVVLQSTNGDLGFKMGLSFIVIRPTVSAFRIFRPVRLRCGWANRAAEKNSRSLPCWLSTKALVVLAMGRGRDRRSENRALRAGHQALEDLDQDCCSHPAPFLIMNAYRRRGNREIRLMRWRAPSFRRSGLRPLPHVRPA